MPSSTDAAAFAAAAADFSAAAARMAELFLGASALLAPSDAHGASGAATSVPDAMTGRSLVAGAGAVSAPEAPSKDSSPGHSREIVFSAPSQRPRVLGLDEGEARLLLANALAVLEHARTRVYSSRRPQLDAVAKQIRTALDGRMRERPRTPPDSGAVAVAA